MPNSRTVPTLPRPPAFDPMERFAAIDFETADYGRDSACSMAIVVVENLQVVEKHYHLIRPPRQRFAFTDLHGISWSDVATQPTFREIWPAVWKKLDGIAFMAAHYAPFDKGVLAECCRRGLLPVPDVTFQCTVTLARKTWGIYPTKLPDVCRHLQIPLQHHNAESDALACANIVIAARRAGISRASGV